MQIEQLLTTAGYTYEDTLIVACPTAEQVSVFISSASLISHPEPVLPYGKKRKISTIQRPSIASVQEKPEEKTADSSVKTAESSVKTADSSVKTAESSISTV